MSNQTKQSVIYESEGRYAKVRRIIWDILIWITALLLVLYSVLEVQPDIANSSAIKIWGLVIDSVLSALIYPITGKSSSVGVLFCGLVLVVFNMTGAILIDAILALPTYLICRFIVRRRVSFIRIMVVCTILQVMIMLPDALEKYEKVDNTKIQSQALFYHKHN